MTNPTHTNRTHDKDSNCGGLGLQLEGSRRYTSQLNLGYFWTQLGTVFSANVNCSSVRPSLPFVCLLSVTFVRPTQAIEIFGNVPTLFGTLAICDLSEAHIPVPISD